MQGTTSPAKKNTVIGLAGPQDAGKSIIFNMDWLVVGLREALARCADPSPGMAEEAPSRHGGRRNRNDFETFRSRCARIPGKA